MITVAPKVFCVLFGCCDFVPQNAKKVSSKHLHQVLPHVEQRFVKIRQHEKAGHSSKWCPPPPNLPEGLVFAADKLVSIVKANPKDMFMVFCNTVPSCDWTARHLRSYDIPLTKLHGGFSSVVRRNTSLA